MNKKDIVVVIPIYNSLLKPEEKKSLSQCSDILSEYRLIVVKPTTLNIDNILLEFPNLETENFPDTYFTSVRTYNKLVLEAFFYQRFKMYQYMLIYQLDAFVFKDELLLWALKGYDYIGAPWLPICQRKKNKRSLIVNIKYFIYYTFRSPRCLKCKYHEYEVGNGGFSLRKIDKMIDLTIYYRKKINALLSDNAPFYPEDVFLCVEITNKKYSLKKPKFDEAMKFSMEVGASWAYEYNNRELPFGCHAWYHPNFISFWKSIIKF